MAETWDTLTEEEATFVATLLEELAEVSWARRIATDIEASGGITKANKSLFFELRLGYALKRAGIEPEYEAPGEGSSTIDFRFEHNAQAWLIELMRLKETDATQRATADWKDEDGTQWTQRALSTNADDQTQSEEGETLKAIERICQKCERDGHPHKFREPANAYHAILVDFRTFLNGSSDTADMEHIALGGTKLADVYKRYWKGELIKGVFEVKNTLRGAQTLRDRVHFIGFVHEKAYEAGEFERSIYWVANPHLFETEQEAIKAITKWPSTESKYIGW